MRVIAVVPAWNARPRIARTIDVLLPEVEAVVVVDNGSEDGTGDWLAEHRPEVILVRHEVNLGYPAAVNRSIAEAEALEPGGLLLVNDDVVFDRGAVVTMSKVLSRYPAAAAVSAKMVYRARPGVLNGTGGRFDRDRGWAALRGEGEPDDGRYDDDVVVDYPSGAASLLRWSAVCDVGPLDEAYFLYFEDTDWGLRAGARGWHTRYEPRARAVHVGSAGTAGDPARRRYYNVRNRLLLASRYASRRGRVAAWRETLALAAKQPARRLYAKRRRDADAVLLGVRDHVRGTYGRSAAFG